MVSCGQVFNSWVGGRPHSRPVGVHRALYQLISSHGSGPNRKRSERHDFSHNDRSFSWFLATNNCKPGGRSSGRETNHSRSSLSLALVQNARRRATETAAPLMLHTVFFLFSTEAAIANIFPSVSTLNAISLCHVNIS